MIAQQTHEKLYKEICPFCGSNKVKNKGIKQHTYRTTRQFKCSNCHKYFSVIIKEFPRPERTFLDTANLLKTVNRPIPSFDSIVGIPCFGCNEANRGCNPNLCDKMENWLMRCPKKEKPRCPSWRKRS
jgi:transcription elongation factor Elf1